MVGFLLVIQKLFIWYLFSNCTICTIKSAAQYSTYIHAPWTSTNIWWQSISDISGCLFPIHQTWWIRTCSHTWLSGCRNLHPYLSLLWLCHQLLTPISPRVLPGNFCEGCLVRHSGSPCLTTPTTRDGQPSSCLLLHISCSLSSFNIKMGCRQEERQGRLWYPPSKTPPWVFSFLIWSILELDG